MKRRIYIVIVSLLLLNVVPIVAEVAEAGSSGYGISFWVSTDGDDITGNGKSDNPWRHIQFALEYAVNLQGQPGYDWDFIWIWVYPGVYEECVFLMGTFHSYEISEISIMGCEEDGWGNGHPSDVVIKGDNLVGQDRNIGIWIDGNSNVHDIYIESLTVTGFKTGIHFKGDDSNIENVEVYCCEVKNNEYDGIDITHVTGVKIDNCWIHHNDECGVRMTEVTGISGHYHRCMIENSDIEFNGFAGVLYFDSSWFRIRRSGLRNNGIGYKVPELYYMRSGIVIVSGCHDGLIGVKPAGGNDGLQIEDNVGFGIYLETFELLPTITIRRNNLRGNAEEFIYEYQEEELANEQAIDRDSVILFQHEWQWNYYSNYPREEQPTWVPQDAHWIPDLAYDSAPSDRAHYYNLHHFHRW